MRLSTATNIIKASCLDQWSAHGGQYVTCYLEGSAGGGKTSAVRQVADELGAVFIDQRLTDRDFTEVSGWRIPNADNSAMIHLTPDWFDFDPAKKYVLFFDELPQAPVTNQNIAAQIINERSLGGHVLPDNVAIVCAGNPAKDRSGTNTMPTHLRDRLTWLQIESDLEDVVGYFAANNRDPLVIGYLRARPDNLHKFDRDAKACPSPRSWDKVSTLLGFDLPEGAFQHALFGTVGDGVGADFLAYKKLTTKAPAIKDIIADPDGTRLPEESDVLYALCAGISASLKPDNATPLCAYLDRIPQKEMVAFVMRDALKRDPDLKQANAVRDWALNGGVDLLN